MEKLVATTFFFLGGAGGLIAISFLVWFLTRALGRVTHLIEEIGKNVWLSFFEGLRIACKRKGREEMNQRQVTAVSWLQLTVNILVGFPSAFQMCSERTALLHGHCPCTYLVQLWAGIWAKGCSESLNVLRKEQPRGSSELPGLLLQPPKLRGKKHQINNWKKVQCHGRDGMRSGSCDAIRVWADCAGECKLNAWEKGWDVFFRSN